MQNKWGPLWRHSQKSVLHGGQCDRSKCHPWKNKQERTVCKRDMREALQDLQHQQSLRRNTASRFEYQSAKWASRETFREGCCRQATPPRTLWRMRSKCWGGRTGFNLFLPNAEWVSACGIELDFLKASGRMGLVTYLASAHSLSSSLNNWVDE